jgi:hypothetical protein
MDLPVYFRTGHFRFGKCSRHDASPPVIGVGRRAGTERSQVRQRTRLDGRSSAEADSDRADQLFRNARFRAIILDGADRPEKVFRHVTSVAVRIGDGVLSASTGGARRTPESAN